MFVYFKEIKQFCLFTKCWQHVTNKVFLVLPFMLQKENFCYFHKVSPRYYFITVRFFALHEITDHSSIKNTLSFFQDTLINIMHFHKTLNI